MQNGKPLQDWVGDLLADSGNLFMIAENSSQIAQAIEEAKRQKLKVVNVLSAMVENPPPEKRTTTILQAAWIPVIRIVKKDERHAFMRPEYGYVSWIKQQ